MTHPQLAFVLPGLGSRSVGMLVEPAASYVHDAGGALHTPVCGPGKTA
ncbi:MAG: hypothetical protein JNN30_01265 [Rhodanobacteraceae bacterium]|nr:hypothetical protein [Rhodanobacteraceae bacterium]